MEHCLTESEDKPTNNAKSNENALKKADIEGNCIPEQLLCKLCTEGYKEPRILPCLHSFCNECLQKEIEKASSLEVAGSQAKLGDSKDLKCPTCQKKVIVKTVNDLPQHLYLGFEVEVAGLARHLKSTSGVSCDGCRGSSNSGSNLIKGFCGECQEFLCKDCLDYHKRNRNLSKHKVAFLDEQTSIEDKLKLMVKEYNCIEHGHEKQLLDFYCATCTKPVCNYCVVSQHKDHSFYELSKAASEQRAEIQQLQESACSVLLTLANATSNTDKMKQQVDASKKNATTLINSTFEELYHALQEREKALLSMVDKIAESKSKSLQSQIDGFKVLENDFKQNKEMMTRVLQTNTDQQVVALRKLLHTSMAGMMKDFEKVVLLPNQHSSISVFMDKRPLNDEVTKFGQVDDCVLDKSTWSWLSPSTPIVTPHIDKKYQLCVEMKNVQGEGLKTGGMPLVVEFTPNIQNQNVVADIEDNKNGSYTISFTSAYAGDCKVRISVQGHCIQNSPFDIKFVKRNYMTATNLDPRPAASGCRLLGQWQCVAVHSDGSIISGTYNGSHSQVHIHGQQDNKCMRSIGGTNGSGNGSFNSPRGLAVIGDALYVADLYNNRIQKFKASGFFDYQNTIGLGNLSQPNGLCVDAKGNIFVADFANSRIQVFDANSAPNAAPKLTIVGNRAGNLNFVNPTGVALDHAGNLHVAARETGAIKVFTPAGDFVRMYGERLKPAAIAIDSCGYCLVADSAKNQICIYDPDGSLKNTLNGLNNPTGVAVCQNGNLYVANYGSYQILQC